MRFYLSSYHLGGQPQLFAALVGDNASVALIMNAGDAFGDEAVRASRVAAQTTELASIGLRADDLDLRHYFGRANDLRLALDRYGGVWIPGGNVFVLRRAMRDSGFDEVITNLLVEDRIAYGGYSAGICVLAPTLRGIDLADDPPAVERTFGRPVVWEGLGLLSYTPVPHYKSDHFESELMDGIVGYMKREGLAYRTLRDGEAIYINGSAERVIGEPMT